MIKTRELTAWYLFLNVALGHILNQTMFSWFGCDSRNIIYDFLPGLDKKKMSS